MREERREREGRGLASDGGGFGVGSPWREGGRGVERLGSFGFSFSWVNYHIRIGHLVG